MKRDRRLAFVVLAGLFALLSPSAGSDWTRWRGPANNGISLETDWKPEALARPKIRWRTNVGIGLSCVTVAGDRLYTVGNFGGRDIVSCLDAKTAKPIWRQMYRCPAGNFYGPRATPALDGGLLYTLSRNGQAFCFEADTGKIKWQKNLIKEFRARNTDYGITGSPLIVGDAVIYNACTSGIALNKLTGEKIWASRPGLCSFASPVSFELNGKTCVAIFSAAGLFVLDVATGEELHSIPWRTPFDANAADPLFFDGKIFITTGWERGCALIDLSAGRGRQIWENKNLRSQFASPIYLDGHIYGIDDNTPNGQLRCIDARTGEGKWAMKGGFASLVMAGGKLIAMDKRGVLHIVEADPTAYKELAKATVLTRSAKNWTSPVLANGFIYCRDGKGNLVSLDVR